MTNWKYKTIAFLGTDGSGKSAVIDAITPLLKEKYTTDIHYEHLRPNYISSLGVAMGKRTKEEESKITKIDNPHTEKPSGFAGSLFRLSYYWIDYTWGYYRKIYKSKGIWIFDRYFYDFIIDPYRGKINLPQWLIKLFGCFIPSPDLIICLGTDANKIHQRKPELPLNEIQRQVDKLKSFSGKHKRTVWIDTGCSIAETTENTMHAINNCFHKNVQSI
jgi:thymidylate kinase